MVAWMFVCHSFIYLFIHLLTFYTVGPADVCTLS